MAYQTNLFINCPFDSDYFPLFKPLIFTVLYCRLNPNISQTISSGSTRLDEIKALIRQSKYSIHDLSRIEPRTPADLPRFNMPFELGIDIGCNTYYLTDKKFLILEQLKYRYQQVISDIAGQDIKSHNNDPFTIVKSVRDWFRAIFPRRTIQSNKVIWDAYNEFHYDFESQMNIEGLNPNDISALPFNELIIIMKRWISNH